MLALAAAGSWGNMQVCATVRAYGADITVREVAMGLHTATAEARLDLGERDLSGLDFSRLDFRAADLTVANLRNANLTGAELTGADLSGAMLEGANLDGTHLAAAKLSVVQGLDAPKNRELARNSGLEVLENAR